MYKITIEQTKEETKIEGKEWVVVGSEEVKRDVQFLMGDNDEPKTIIVDKHDYSPEITKKRMVTTKVYEQIVDDLNMQAVLDAVNKGYTS